VSELEDTEEGILALRAADLSPSPAFLIRTTSLLSAIPAPPSQGYRQPARGQATYQPSTVKIALFAQKSRFCTHQAARFGLPVVAVQALIAAKAQHSAPVDATINAARYPASMANEGGPEEGAAQSVWLTFRELLCPAVVTVCVERVMVLVFEHGCVPPAHPIPPPSRTASTLPVHSQESRARSAATREPLTPGLLHRIRLRCSGSGGGVLYKGISSSSS
jgi:hypothetical protein